MNNIDKTKKIQFTMEVVKDLKLTFNKEFKSILVVFFAKVTDSFTCVLPSTSFPKSSIENVPKGVALR